MAYAIKSFIKIYQCKNRWLAQLQIQKPSQEQSLFYDQIENQTETAK
jgi:hypothetical protein